MSGIATAVVGGAVISGVVASKSASKAAKAQTQAAETSADVQMQQFEAIQELLKPYVEAGTGAVGAQQALLGLLGANEQAAAIAALEASPQYTSIVEQGEEALLQNAAATGGLRGGNVQSALAQFRPQVLSQLIESQYNKLGQISQLGQASAAGQASAGLQTGSNIANLLTQAGQAQAGATLAQGQAISGVADSASQLAMLKALKVF